MTMVTSGKDPVAPHIRPGPSADAQVDETVEETHWCMNELRRVEGGERQTNPAHLTCTACPFADAWIDETYQSMGKDWGGGQW